MVQEKLRAVFYARVSTEEERQLNALEKQVAECCFTERVETGRSVCR